MEEEYKSKNPFLGRKKKKESEKQSVHIDFKCTKEEKEKIIKKASTLSVSEYVRRAALDKSLKILSTIDRETRIELSRMGNNINQIARVLNATKDPCEIKKFQDDIENINKRLGDIYFAIIDK